MSEHAITNPLFLQMLKESCPRCLSNLGNGDGHLFPDRKPHVCPVCDPEDHDPMARPHVDEAT